MLKINKDAIFISDSHENINKTYFLEFLHSLKSGKIPLPSQLFLLGDMFDVLTCTSYFQLFFKEHIQILNELSKKIEIFYFEGNHDFNLKEIFPNIKIFTIKNQPAYFKFNDKCVAIAHGDIFLAKRTMLALKLLRIPFMLKFLDFIDKKINNKISKAILHSQENKILDYEIFNFKDKISARIPKFNADIIIEGHWHQDKIFNIDKKFYINLPSFACKQRIFMLEYEKFTL